MERCSKVATCVRSKGKVSRNVLDPDYNDCHARSLARWDPYSSYKSRSLLVISAMVPSTPLMPSFMAPIYIEAIPDSDGGWGTPCYSIGRQGSVVEAFLAWLMRPRRAG